MKPYVNFNELNSPEFADVKLALKHLGRVLFSRSRKRRYVMTWEQWEATVLEMFAFRGKKRALFIGHSRRWAGTPLI